MNPQTVQYKSCLCVVIFHFYQTFNNIQFGVVFVTYHRVALKWQKTQLRLKNIANSPGLRFLFSPVYIYRDV